MLYGPLRFISFFPRWFTEAMTAAERIFEVMDVEPDGERPAKAAGTPSVGEVVIKNVTFGYKSHEPVSKGINLTSSRARPSGLWAIRARASRR